MMQLETVAGRVQENRLCLSKLPQLRVPNALLKLQRIFNGSHTCYIGMDWRGRAVSSLKNYTSIHIKLLNRTMQI
jgi:hypothetical protein